VYSFGVVMWEVATRKQPFAGRNFMGVSLDVLEGKRPKVPADLPPAFKKLLKRYLHLQPPMLWLFSSPPFFFLGAGMKPRTRDQRQKKSSKC
jgi:hypothetical protein